jgi:hypothetical protein
MIVHFYVAHPELGRNSEGKFRTAAEEKGTTFFNGGLSPLTLCGLSGALRGPLGRSV